ncbi:MAG TPA: flagellar biosynthetic protein FliR, partial [Spirochaetia bacterium]|nr:flagellar biosynthetic protein FliR [Spirochaetia bacterium]
VVAIVEIAPLLSSSAIPQPAKIGLALLTTVIVFPWVSKLGYAIPANIVDYFLLVAGEVLIGVIIGFFLALIYSVFQVAGEFFAFQMGFGASSVFDPLAQVEVPLMGQYLNVVAMLVFVTIGGFQKIFISGVYASFKSLTVPDILSSRKYLLTFFVGSIAKLFENALTISFPILGTLFIISVCLGLLAKAAPQMNLLMLGFPISITVTYLFLFLILPFLGDAASRLISASFRELEGLYRSLGGAS